jgi:hypothetical protein
LNVAEAVLALLSGALKIDREPVLLAAARFPAESTARATPQLKEIARFGVELLVSGRVYCRICPGVLSLAIYRCCGPSSPHEIRDMQDKAMIKAMATK